MRKIVSQRGISRGVRGQNVAKDFEINGIRMRWRESGVWDGSVRRSSSSISQLA
jgi:hypothetical protein